MCRSAPWVDGCGDLSRLHRGCVAVLARLGRVLSIELKGEVFRSTLTNASVVGPLDIEDTRLGTYHRVCNDGAAITECHKYAVLKKMMLATKGYLRM